MSLSRLAFSFRSALIIAFALCFIVVAWQSSANAQDANKARIERLLEQQKSGVQLNEEEHDLIRPYTSPREQRGFSPRLSVGGTYTSLYYQDAGNPRGLNTEGDAPGTSGWTNIVAGPQAANLWSPVQTIPFTFEFFGNTVTHYKASQNGLVTFDTATVLLPNANTNLPSTSLPPSTIAGMWDEFTSAPPTGTGDDVRIKVFGTSPNQQLWIKWYSFEYGNPNVSFSYWAIVLEEGTNKVYVVDQYNSTTPLLTSTVGLQMDNTTADQFGDSTIAQSGNASTNPDNDYWEFFIPVPNDVGASQVFQSFSGPFPYPGTSIPLSAEVRNFGLNPQSGFTVGYTVDDGSSGSLTYSGTLAPGATDTVSFSAPWVPATADTFTVKAFTALVGDGIVANDTATASTTVYPILALNVEQDFAAYSGNPGSIGWFGIDNTDFGTFTPNPTNDGSWTSDGFGNVGTSGSARFNFFSTTATDMDWLIAPPINMTTGGPNNILTFDVAVTPFTGTTAAFIPAEDTLFIVASTDGTNWSRANILRSFTAADTIPPTGMSVTLDLTAYDSAPTLYIGFMAMDLPGPNDINIYVDNMFVGVPIAIDVAISQFVNLPPIATVNSLVQFDVAVTNLGVDPVPADSFDLWVNGSVIATYGYSALGASTTENVPVSFTASAVPGTDQVTASLHTVVGDVNTSNDSLSASVTVTQAIAGGTYTVGTGGDYPDLASAFAAISGNGIAGPVTLSLTDNQYIAPGRPLRDLTVAEPEYVTVNGVREFVAQPSLYGNLTGADSPDTVGTLTLTGPIVGASAVNRITISPAAGTNVEINGTGNPVLRLTNASYVTLDGINSGGASLTINSAAGTALLLEGDADNNIVQNLRLRSPSFTSIILAELGGANADNNLITRNTVGPSFNGVFLMSGAATANGLNNRVTMNNFGTATDSIAQAGIIVQNATGTSVDNNVIQNIVRTTATGNALGIGVQTKHFNTQIYNNVVKNVAKIGGTAASTVSGITAFGTAGDTTNSNIYNNMIYNMDNSSTSTTSLIRGLYLSTGLRDTVAYNSVSIAGTDAASIVTAALVVGFPNATAEQTWHNNIGINARTATGTGRALAFYSNTTSGQYLTNYNDLYVMSQAGSHVAAVTTTNYTTLGDWQGTGRDANSISEMANFIAPDLHIDENITTGLSGAATPLPGFTVDFDGNNRSAAIPDIGADEFNQAPAGFVIFEEFETTTFPPSGWSSYIVAGDSGWIHTTTFPLNGTYAARNRYQPPGTLGSKFLVTKRVDLMPGSNYELSFWMRRQFSTAFPPDTVYIRTSTTDSLPASFGAAIYKCYTGAIADTATDPNIYGLVYRKFRTTVTDPNVKYIAFDHQDNDGQTIFMDDVALQSLLGHDIGVSSVASASPGSGQSDSPENGSRNPALNREEKIAAEQGRAITIASPVTGPIVLGSTTQGSVTLEARVANFGGFVENSYQVGWSIDGVPQSDETNIDPLEIGDSDTLALVWSTPTSGIHTARAWSILTGDVDASNDTSGVYTFEVLGANVLFAEGFNDPTFPPAGWTTINRDGGGTTGPWFAGNVTVFPPFEGSGYAADNFNTANGFYIDDYLITPDVAGPAPGPNDVDSLTFWMRSPDPNNFPDSLMILVSTTGIDTSNFTVNLGYYNAPTSWTRFAFALPTGANRYVAFRYLIYDGGPSGTNSNYVGVDDVRITRYTQAGPEPLMNLVHTPGNLNAAIFNDGSIGADNVGFAGPGITWLGQNGTFVGGPIFGTTARGSVNGLIGSFSIAGQLVNVTSNFAGGFTSDANFNQIATALLDDSGAPVPYGVRILQKSYSNTGEEFVFVRYGYINTTGSAINGFHAGIFNDWDINATTFTTNSGGYDLTRDLVYQFDNGTPPTPYYYGFATLDGLSGARVTTASPPTPTATGSFTWITTFDPTILPNGDFRTWQGTGPMDIAPADTAWTTFAIVAGNDLAGIQANTDAAKAKAIALGWIIPTGVEDPTAGLPESFDLAQNYPNPFNPTTVIRYALPEPSSVTLKIYNVLGQQIAELVNDVKDAGFFQTEWNGRNQYGQLVSSGVYFYRMEARGTNGGNVFVSEKKMLMLK